MSSPVDEFFDAVAKVFRRGLGIDRGEVICARCIRLGDGTRPGEFGDYSVCPRCEASVTSKTPAFFVPHEGLGMDVYRCAVCRQSATDLPLTRPHRCERRDVEAVLSSPPPFSSGS